MLFAGDPAHLTRIQNVVELSGNTNNNCALTQRGTVFYWGDNTLGQLGNGTTTQRSTPSLVKRLKNRAIRLFGGVYHSCALLIDGKQQCWEYNADSQLGNSLAIRFLSLPADVRNP